MKRAIASAVVGLMVIHAGVIFGQTNRATHVSWNAESCMSCHAPQDRERIASRIDRPCRELCMSCHKMREGHHPVGVRIAGPVRPPLLLTREGTNTCSTCHDVTRPRTESATWVSQSLIERAVRRSKENKTFYLAMRNDRGQLCRNCH